MKDNLDKIFENLEGTFDTEEPTIGHFNRFEAKLNKTAKSPTYNGKRLYTFIAIAASFILFFGIWIGASFSNKGMELAAISPEMKETQSYFVTVIEKELRSIEKERNTETEQLIKDALNQINKLKNEYDILTLELKESTEDKRIIYAMISNFQQRIEVLQSLLIRIEDFKELKTQNNEKFV
jgi:DNA repair exonuclease SbcCD nuclease subunit